jgi:hypothetical protein
MFYSFGFFLNCIISLLLKGSKQMNTHPPKKNNLLAWIKYEAHVQITGTLQIQWPDAITGSISLLGIDNPSQDLDGTAFSHYITMTSKAH